MPQRPAIVLTVNQANALDRAWSVLHYGYVGDRHNGYDPAKRNLRQDRAAAAQIGRILDAAGFGEDA